MIVPVTTKGKGIRPIRHHGISAAAKQLGVTRFHLLRVIHGERQSRRLERWLAKNMKGPPQ
jgi:hypothetical protein